MHIELFLHIKINNIFSNLLKLIIVIYWYLLIIGSSNIFHLKILLNK